MGPGRRARARAWGGPAAVGAVLALAVRASGAPAGAGRTVTLRRPDGEKVILAYNPVGGDVQAGGIGWQGQLFPAEEAQKLADLAVEWGDRSGWSEKHGTAELPIYDFSLHGKIGKGVMMDTGLQGLWPLARHLCGTLQSNIDSSVAGTSDYCSSVSIVRFQPRPEPAGEGGEEAAQTFSAGYTPDVTSDLQNFHAKLSPPAAPGGGGEFYQCEQLPASWGTFMTFPSGFLATYGFGHFFSESRLRDPASPCRYVPPLAQGAVLSRLGGRVGGLTDAQGEPSYFVKVSFAAGRGGTEMYLREPYGSKVFENLQLPLVLKVLRHMRIFIQLYVKDTFPDLISNAHLKYGTAVAATEGATERESGRDKRHLSLLVDLTGFFARALKNSEDELVLESARAILHLLSQRSKYAILEREGFRDDAQLGGEKLTQEMLTKYSADKTYVDLGCSLLKKLPCISDDGRLDDSGRNTCEYKVDACEDFDRQQIAQLTQPGPREFDKAAFQKCVEEYGTSFGSEDRMNLGRDCLFQSWLELAHEAKQEVELLSESEKRIRMHAESRELTQIMNTYHEEKRLDEKELFLRRARGEL